MARTPWQSIDGFGLGADPVLVGFAILGLIAFFRKPVDMRAAAGAWKSQIPVEPTDPTKRT